MDMCSGRRRVPRSPSRIGNMIGMRGPPLPLGRRASRPLLSCAMPFTRPSQVKSMHKQQTPIRKPIECTCNLPSLDSRTNSRARPARARARSASLSEHDAESSEQRAEWGIPCSKASAPDTLIVKIALGADAERPLALDVTWRVDSE